MKKMTHKKNVLITGSSRGIGLYIAKKFYESGYFNVILNSRNEKNLKLAIKNFGDSKNVYGVVGDASDQNAAKRIIKNAIKHYGQLDIVICNVGLSSSESKPGFETFNDWYNFLAANLLSAINIIQSSFETLKLTKGNVICVSSICGVEYIAGAPLPYATSKAALNHFVKYISKIYGKYNIRVNSVSPGNILFEGSLWQKKISKNPSIKNLIIKTVPLQKFGTPSDVSNLVFWLASDEAQFVTGSNYVIDGGQVSSI
jgi:3-oxoacyl-[acyl-carrier protein] reductase